MPYIRTISPDEATGTLKRQYDQAISRAGRVFNIVRIQSLNAPVLDASIRLYKTLMLGPGPLSRSMREMLATVTSRELDCFY
jgi:alkylhydroperoxidase family enzyme